MFENGSMFPTWFWLWLIGFAVISVGARITRESKKADERRAREARRKEDLDRQGLNEMRALRAELNQIKSQQAANSAGQLAASPSRVPEGWYQDPRSEAGVFRWWDGSSWTDRIYREG